MGLLKIPDATAPANIKERPAPWPLSAAQVHRRWDWFWKRAIVVHPLWEFDQDHVFDASNVHLGTLQSNATWSLGSAGYAFTATATAGSHISVPDSDAFDDVTRHGLAVMFEKNGWVDGAGLSGRFSTPSVNEQHVVFCGNVTNVIRVNYYAPGSVIATVPAHSEWYDNTPTVLFSQMTAANAHTAYAGKAWSLSVYDSGPASGSNYNLGSIRDLAIGDYNASGSAPWNGRVYWHALFREADTITDEQHKDLMLDPWGPFRRIPQSFFVFTGAAPPGGIIHPILRDGSSIHGRVVRAGA